MTRKLKVLSDEFIEKSVQAILYTVDKYVNQSSDATNIRLITDAMGIPVSPFPDHYEDFYGEVLSILAYMPGLDYYMPINAVLRVKPGLNERDLRFIISRELGYFVLYFDENECCSVEAHKTKTFKHRSPIEKSLDYFARCLLMPRDKFCALNKTLLDNGLTLEERVDVLRKRFIVSDNLVRERLGEVWIEEQKNKSATHKA